MRVVLWAGNEPNQYALAGKIARKFELAGVVSESRNVPRKWTVGKVFEKVTEKLLLPSVGASWRAMQQNCLRDFSSFNAPAFLDVENINSSEARTFTESLNPDVILVSGTRLVKKQMLELRPSVGILNLHTGLSPYIKGGPNCTNWCIATGQFHLVGNTVMWIDEGIDSGNIFATEFTDFTGTDDLNAIHVKVMDHAHDLVVRSLESISKGSRTSVKQSEIAKGVTYYTRDWNLKQKFALVRNIDGFNRCMLSGECLERRKHVRIVPVA